MKKGKKILLIAGIVVATLLAVMAAAAFPGMGAVRRMTVDAVDLSQVADGRYQGSFKKGRFSYAVQVEVKDHRIQAAASTGSAQAQNEVVKRILARIVEAQSVPVDTVSGASLTTKAVSKAVQSALHPGRE